MSFKTGQPKRIRKWQGNLLMILLGAGCAVIVFELCLRLFYDITEPFDIGAIEAWNPLDDSQFTPKLNNFGFREAALDETVLTENTTKILFLGDSFTFGQGVTRGENRFSDIIERSLNESLPIGATEKFHIYNASRPGSEPVDWLNFYERVISTYSPSHVFAIFFLRDGTDLCTSFRCYEDVFAEISSNYTERFFYKYSFIGKLFYHREMTQEFSDFYVGQIQNAYLGSGAETRTWQIQQEALLELRTLSEKNGSSFRLIIFPVLFDLNKNYQFYEVEEEITRFAKEERIPVFSLTPGFIGENAADLWVSANDQHPNERGHQIAADTLLPYVIEVVSK